MYYPSSHSPRTRSQWALLAPRVRHWCGHLASWSRRIQRFFSSFGWDKHKFVGMKMPTIRFARCSVALEPPTRWCPMLRTNALATRTLGLPTAALCSLWSVFWRGHLWEQISYFQFISGIITALSSQYLLDVVGFHTMFTTVATTMFVSLLLTIYLPHTVYGSPISWKCGHFSWKL